jgi:hypothetical protein
VFWQLWRRAPGEKWLRFDWRNMAALLIPLAIGGMALATYNYVRFGSPLEFGYKYQVNDFNGPKLAAEGVLISGAYVWPNLYSYFLRPVMWIRQFPFMVEPFYMPNAFPADFTLPARYFVKEPTTGILKVAPFIWLAIVPVVLAAWRRRPVGAPAGRSVLWLVVGLLGAAGLAAVGPMQLVSSTNRYLADFVPCLVMLAVIGMWQLHVFVVGKKWLNRLFKTLVGRRAPTPAGRTVAGRKRRTGSFQHAQPQVDENHEAVHRLSTGPRRVHTDPRPPLYPVAGDLWSRPAATVSIGATVCGGWALQQPMEFRITFVEPFQVGDRTDHRRGPARRQRRHLCALHAGPSGYVWS